MWLPARRRKTKPARSKAVRSSRPRDRSEAWPLCGFYLDIFAAILDRNWVAGFTAILDIEFNRFPDIGERFVAIIAVANASRQGGDTREDPPSDSLSSTTVLRIGFLSRCELPIS
jgi:hypothetical protein